MPTSYNMGTNAWNGWEVEVLNDLGAKTSKNNIAFLDWWQEFEHSDAVNNPLNLTKPIGVGSINSDGVQSYKSQTLAAQYTADNIKRYPTLYKMLKTDNVSGTLLGSTDVFGGHLSSLQHLVSELNTWGSHNFANKLSGGTSSIDKTVTTGQSIWSSWQTFFNWLSGNWDRVLFVAGGAILIIIAILIIGKSQTQKATFSFARGE
jgi:hypothetical protein